MQLQYTQGLVRGQQDPTSNAKLFLQKSGLNVSIYVTDQPLQAIVAHRGSHYLIAEPVNVATAWTVPPGACWLYWDIDRTTGVITRGVTTRAPTHGASDPNDLPELNLFTGQHYYDTTAMRHYVWETIPSVTEWTEVIRVFAASINTNGVLIPMPFASQVGLTGAFRAGFIIHTLAGIPLLDPQTTTFLNTGTGYLLKTSASGLVQLDLSYEPLFGIAAESMGALSIVRINDNGLYELADGPTDKPGIAITAFGVSQGSVFKPQPTGLIRGNFGFDIDDLGKSVWLGPNGTLLTVRPTTYQSQLVGIILGTDALFLTLVTSQPGELLDGINLTISPDAPAVLAETSIPVDQVGTSSYLLGAPAVWLNVVVAGTTYVLPAYLPTP